MQSKLPDINTALVYYRSEANKAMREASHAQENINTAITAIYAMIALLPDDYKLEINTDKFLELSRNKRVLICSYCDTETDTKTVQIEEIILNSLERLVHKTKTQKVWECPECNEQNFVNLSRSETIGFAEPAYFGVIPSPPSQKSITNRVGFDQSFQEWFRIAMKELEKKIGEYRADYAAQDTDDAGKYDDVEDE